MVEIEDEPGGPARARTHRWTRIAAGVALLPFLIAAIVVVVRRA